MKYSNWSQVFANDPNSDSYDKNAADVANLMIDTISANKCIENIKKEPNLIYLYVEPITKAVKIIHHLTAIRENITMPETVLVAFSGFEASALAVHIDPKIFNGTKEFKVPSWEKITGLVNTANLATTTTNVRNVKLKFRHIIALPPFLVKTVIASISKTTAELIVEFIATIKAFDTSHATGALFPSAINACRRIPYFLWAASHDKIPVIVLVPQSDGITKQFLDDLTEKHILSNIVTPPNPNNVAGPSDATLNLLAGNIQILNNRLETDSKDKKADKDDKKDKFKCLPSSSQQIFLFDFVFSANSKRVVPNSYLEAFLQQTTQSRARTHLKQVI